MVTPESQKGTMTKEQQALAFYDWYFDIQKGFVSEKSFLQSELLYYANMYLEMVVWSDSWTEEELVSEFRKIAAKKSAETKKLRAERKAEEALRKEKAARQGDLFD